MKGILAIYGLRGTGKTTLATKLVNISDGKFFFMKQLTSRKMRKEDYKNDLLNYRFLRNNMIFDNLVNKEYKDDYIARTVVNGNKYATYYGIYEKDPFYDDKIGIILVNKEGMKNLISDLRDKNKLKSLVRIGILNLNTNVIKRNKLSDLFPNLFGYLYCDKVFLIGWKKYIDPNSVLDYLEEYKNGVFKLV